MPHPSDESAGETQGQDARAALGRYRIERTLGRGGMGEVLLATDTLLDRRVALKRMLPAGADRASVRAAILREARRASQINDPHVAAIYDVLDLDDQVVLVMEYVDGVTLRRRMADPVSIEEFWSLASQCAEGLAAAHAQGVIHRDIKPENLMLTRGGLVKILDFGIARRAPGGHATTTTTDHASVAGTPQYMPPETHLGGAVDERGDVFAMGAVFYELLTGRRPFEGDSYAAVIYQVLQVDPPPVLELNPAAGPELSSLVSRMLAKDPSARFATAVELAPYVSHARRGTGPLPPFEPPAVAPARKVVKPEPTPRTRAMWALPVSSLVGVAVIVGAGTMWRTLAAPSLPRDMNVAVLAPRTSGDSNFVPFAMGAFELLGMRLRRRTTNPHLQLASFSDVVERNVGSAAEARKLLGANLALASSVDQTSDAYHARLDLIDTASNRRIGTRTIDVPAAAPFEFLDRTYRAATELLGLGPDTPLDCGVRGAGTLRFHLQGYGRLRMARTTDDQQAALGDFETACRMEPAAAVTRAGAALAQLGLAGPTNDSTWLARAEVSARQAVRLDPTRPEGHRVLAVVLGNLKRHQEASEEYARVVELDSTDDEASHMRGRMFNRLGQPERELQVYRETIARRPHCWPPYWWLAAGQYRRGNVDEAIQSFREMIRRSPLNFEGYSSLGGVLVLRGDYAPAIDTLKHSLALRPTKNAFDNLGTAYFNSGRVQEAIDAYNQSFQFDQADYVAWMNLGDAYSWLQGRQADAAGAYAQAIRLGRDEIHTRSMEARSVNVMIPADLAMVFARIGEPDSARLYLGRAISSDSTNPMVQYCAAVTYWQLNEKDRGVGWLQKSVQGGYPTAWLRDSPIFREWRASPAFRALVGEASNAPKPS